MRGGFAFLRATAFSAVAAFVFSPGAHAQGSGPFTSPALDPSVFREGAIKRSSSKHGEWTVVCDEVVAVRQRQCSLFYGRGKLDGDFVQMIASTSEDGKPAAILRVPLGILLEKKLRLSALGLPPEAPRKRPAKGAKKAPAKAEQARARDLFLVSCDQKMCYSVFPMSSDEIMALMTGKGLSVRYVRPTNDGQGQAVDIPVSSAGFREAIAASQAR